MPQPASSSDLLLTVPTTDRQRADLSAALGHPKRLAAVELLALLEAPAEQSFDRLTRLAAKVLRAPVAFLSLVDGGRSVFKSSVGLPEPWVSRREIPLSHSVCRYVVAANAPLVIDDARSHPLAVDNQAVAELRIVAYLGTPLVTSDGYPLGTLAVIDTVPRAWTPEDVSVLGDLAASAMTEIELRAETDQRQRVEQHLGLLETAVGNATDAVLVAEADPSDPSETRVVFVNEAYTRQTGFSAGEVIGTSHWGPKGPETDRSQADTVRAAVADRTPARLEFLTRRKDGTEFWAELNVVSIADKGGRYSHWVIVQRDVSDRRAAEVALGEAEAALRRGDTEMRRLALIAQRTDNAVILTDEEGRIEWVNEGFTRISEYRLDEVIGKRPGSVLQGPDTDPATKAHMRERLRQGQGFQVEILNYAKSGRIYWQAIEVQPLRDDTGTLTGYMAIQSDVTERRWAKEMLRGTQEMLRRSNQELEVRVAQRTAELSEANEFLKALLDNVQDGIVACDAKGVLTLFNPSTREFHGLPALPIPPDQWADHYSLYQVDGRTPMTPDEIPLRRALRGERVRNVEMVITSNTGVERTVLASGQAFFDGRGNKLGAVVSMSDITERKRAEVELRAAHNELEQRVEDRTAQLALAKRVAEDANRAKSEFFSRMSHELRTPLNVILGFNQLLEMDALTGPQRESTAQIGSGGRHLLALVNDVLDIARIEAGGAGMLSPEKIDLGSVVGDVLGMVRPLADSARVQLLPPDGTGDRAVRADLQRLKQVLLNLLSNAIKYNRDGGTVAVGCSDATGGMVRVSVTDTGPGIAPERMHRLFAPFDRLDADQSGKAGTGLGLTLSKGLVEAMGGTMGADSTLGGGSTFWFELPGVQRVAGLVEEPLPPVRGGEGRSAATGTVLYVEDNPANFRLVERVLQLRPGVRLLSAMQGRLGLALAREHRPDVIFLDLHLPDIPGAEVLRELKAGPTKDIPVVVLSADASPHQIERLLAAGASRYLVKPIQVTELLHILDETLDPGGR